MSGISRLLPEVPDQGSERCYGIIIAESLYPHVEYALRASQQINHFIITTHDESCRHITSVGLHYHAMVWCRASLSELTLGRRFRRYGQRNVDYRYEIVRNTHSLLMYITQPPREILHNQLSEYWRTQLDGVRHEQRVRMQRYIDNRDAPPEVLPQPEIVDEPVPVAPTTGRKNKIHPQDAFNAMISNRVRDYDELLETLMITNPDLYWSYAAPANRKHLETIINDAVRVYYRQWSWARQAQDRAWKFTPENNYLTVEQTRDWCVL